MRDTRQTRATALRKASSENEGFMAGTSWVTLALEKPAPAGKSRLCGVARHREELFGLKK
jgi:hypothetical protein